MVISLDQLTREFHVQILNFLMHTSVCWHSALLEDVSVIVMAQVDKASLAPAQHHGDMQQ